MIFDKENLYSDAQAVTASAASTNYIDHGVARDLGTGENLYLVVACVTAMTDSGSDSTVAVALEVDGDSAFGSVDNTITVGTFSALSAAGTVKYLRLPPGSVNSRYTRVYYTVANGNLTTGSFTAFLTRDIDKYVAYADGITIS